MNVEREQAERTPAEAQRGVVAAELALLLPIILLLLFGLIQFGIAFNRSLAVQGAAREGARVASIPTTTQAEACARALSSLGTVGFVGAPNCSWSGGCAGGAETVVVTIDAVTQLQIPFWPNSGQVGLNGTGEFRCE